MHPGRARRIAACGRLHAGSFDGELVVIPVRCRDRACPPCALRRSAALAEDLTAEIKQRGKAGTVLWAVCFSQPKPRSQKPAVALDNIRNSWAALWSTRHAEGRRTRDRHAGAFRCLEVTWSEEGAKRKHGGAVEWSGYHAHVHAIVEGGTARDVETTLARWCEVSGASAAAHGARAYDAVRIDYAAELAAYDMKALSFVPKERIAALYAALAGKRLHQGLGTWRSWRKKKEATGATVMVSSCTIGELYRAKSDGRLTYEMFARGRKDGEVTDLREFFEKPRRLLGADYGEKRAKVQKPNAATLVLAAALGTEPTELGKLIGQECS